MSAWPIFQLGEIFEIARGGSPRPIDDFITEDPDGINWIMIGDASEGSKYISKTKKRIRSEGARKSRAVKPGDFLLTNSMSFGHPYILNTSGCVHDGWLVLSPRMTDISPDFFYYLLSSDNVYSEFERRAAGATVKNLNSELVKGVKVPVPPLPEQRRIAEIMDKAGALRAKRRDAIAHLDILTQSIFLDFFGDPAANPRRWVSQPLHAIIRDGDAVNYGVVQPGTECKDGVPIVRVGDLSEGRVNLSGLKRIDPSIEGAYKRSRLRGDEILVSCVGSVGVVALAEPSLRGFNIARAVARIPLKESVDRIFVAHYLNTEFVQSYFTSELRIVSQPTLNIKQLSETKILLPPLDVQREFARRVRAIDQLRSAQKRFLSRLDDLLSSLQHFAFCAEL